MDVTIKTYLAFADRREPVFVGYELTQPLRVILGFKDMPQRIRLTSAIGSGVILKARSIWESAQKLRHDGQHAAE